MIDVFLINDKAFVWNHSDVCTLREKHRIVGELVGCLPRLPRQNIQLGLPLQLLPEEVSLLLDKGVIRVVHNTPASGDIVKADVEAFQAERKYLYNKQIEACREDAKQRARMNLPEILEGLRGKKRKEIEKRRAGGEDVSDSELDTVQFDVDSMEIPPLAEKHSVIQIPTACTRDRQYPPADWNYPSTPSQSLRYRVFKAFHDKGLWLTSGGKFGGDFLVYPGDPSRFHSYYIAVCVPYEKKLPALDIMTFSRLGTNVKKTVVLCSLNSDTDQVTYTSLQWTGIT